MKLLIDTHHYAIIDHLHLQVLLLSSLTLCVSVDLVYELTECFVFLFLCGERPRQVGISIIARKKHTLGKKYLVFATIITQRNDYYKL